jgi:hypothetical protein
VIQELSPPFKRSQKVIVFLWFVHTPIRQLKGFLWRRKKIIRNLGIKCEGSSRIGAPGEDQ